MRVSLRRVARACVVALLVILLVMPLSACSVLKLAGTSEGSNAGVQETTEETRIFVDSAGREVEVPVNIERIAPSGNTAQMVLLSIAPEKMVGLANTPSSDIAKFVSIDVSDMPTFGALYGSKGSLNKEALAAADPQVIIDTGEAKDGIAEDLDNLQEQMGIPFVFIETTLDNYGTAYEMLGDLLGETERAQELADYCNAAYKETVAVMDTIPTDERANVAYLLGDSGLNAIAKDSYQGQVIDLCANNVVEVDNASGAGSGNEIDLEQLALWDPDIILFGPDSIYDSVYEEAAWKELTAVKTKEIYLVPSTPYNWLNYPPTVNQVMGMQWLPRLLYPEKFDTSIEDVTRAYYKLFYSYDLSDTELIELLQGAV